MDRCYACQAELKPEFDGLPADHEQWDNALVIELQGGYGMFIDPVEGAVRDRSAGRLDAQGTLRAVICHECAHRLCADVPWLERLIQPRLSHSHSVLSDWAGHGGWDLPHTCPSCGAATVLDGGEGPSCPTAGCPGWDELPLVPAS